MSTRIGPDTVRRIEEAWPDLIAAVAGTGSIAAACERLKIDPAHVRVYRIGRPDKDDEWQRAREQSADYFADQVLEIANSAGADHAIARVRIDAYRWLASKRNPKVYSDKAQLDVNVRTVDLTRIIQDANARLAAARAPRTIEGEVLANALIPRDILS